MPDDSLPAIPDAALEEMVFDGEIVGDAAAGAGPGAPAVPAVRVPRAVAVPSRHAVYIGAGVVVAVRRWHHRRTRHERMQRSLEVTGQHEAMLAWAQQRELERHQRHERWAKRAEVALAVIVAAPVIVGVWLFTMVMTGVLVAIGRWNVRGLGWPWVTLAHVTVTVIVVGPFAAAAVTVVAFLALLAWLHYLGRTGEMTPRWAAASADPDADIEITEVTVTKALADMRFPQITGYLNQNLPLQFLVPCRQEGRGTFARVRLPGVAADKVVRRRGDFAAGLYRQAKEVWPSVGSEAAILDVWIADKGALAEGAGPYPLFDEGFADVFKGLPFGKLLRGDPQRIPVVGRNTLCGGMPDQGKSNGARVVACGYALDITTELRIYVPDTNFDFDPFGPRCSRYVMGAEDEHVEEILSELEELKDEVQQRGQLLVDYEQQEVTRELANAGVGLHPLFVLLEEAHVAIQHRKFGKDVSQLLCDIVKLDRKRCIHLMLSTQAPTKDSMPRDVTRNCSNGIAFAVGDHVANDALLGQGAYAGGHRATELIPGADRGTALCKGFSGQRSDMVQVHKIDVKSDNDQVSPLVARSLAEMQRKGRALPGSSGPLAIEARDLLTDLAEVMRNGEELVRLADLPSRLRRLAPAYGRYKTLTGTTLREQLAELRVRTTNTGNVPRLDVADLDDALAVRGELDARHAAGTRPGRVRSEVG